LGRGWFRIKFLDEIDLIIIQKAVSLLMQADRNFPCPYASNVVKFAQSNNLMRTRALVSAPKLSLDSTTRIESESFQVQDTRCYNVVKDT
jgi:hypothetical protein